MTPRGLQCGVLAQVWDKWICHSRFFSFYTDVGPTNPLDFSYYSYEYEVDPYASEGDTFELTTASSTAAQDNDGLPGAAITTGA